MNEKNLEVKRLPKELYLTIIKNSVGTNLFKNFPLIVNGDKIDAVRNGAISCAFYVSGILSMLNMIESIHGTIIATELDIKNYDFKELRIEDGLEEGDIIVWEGVNFGDKENPTIHEHIGFYIGQGKAISNSEKLGHPIEHNLITEYEGKDRMISRVYRKEFV
ncbi:MAG: hypothetical protein ACRCXZ_02895 [Patescibacteria group bacterium]